MQEEHFDGLVGPVEELGFAKIAEALADQNVKKVELFRKGGQAHQNAEKAWSDLTPNQKRAMRRRLKNRT